MLPGKPHVTDFPGGRLSLRDHHALPIATRSPALAFDALAERAAESFAGSIDRPTLTAKLLPQLEQLYRAGFVVSIHSPSEEDTRHEETEAEPR